MIDADFAVFNVHQLVTAAPGSHPAAEGALGVINGAALAARDGKIVWIGPMAELHGSVRLAPSATILNTHGRTVLPGFVDPHTHPVFAGDRSGEFYARARGASYEEQLETGGIMVTVEATRAASEDNLLALAYDRCDTFLRYGTTTIEAKTGYALTRDGEQRSLHVLNRLQRLHPLKVVPAFLGAHLVPADFTGSADDYVRHLMDDCLPDARESSEVLDVWCEEGIFSEAQCRAILTRGRELGFSLTVHANELAPGPGVRLAAELGALSVDHAVYLDDGDIAALAGSKTVAVLLPGTTFFLGSDTYAPARRLIDAGVQVALGTDFNPGTSYTQNMQFILTLAVLELGMTAEEAIQGATIHAARAVGLQDRVGSLEPGKFCDLTVFSVPEYRAIPYAYAMNLAQTVVASGKVVVSDGTVISLQSARVS